MFDWIKDSVDTVTDKAQNAIETGEYIISGQFWHDFVMKLLLWVVIAIVVLVLVNALFDSVRRIIRGLDVAALGGLFLWFGVKVRDIFILDKLSKPAMTLGACLLAVGLIIFAVFKFIGFKKRAAAKTVNFDSVKKEYIELNKKLDKLTPDERAMITGAAVPQTATEGSLS